MNADPISRIAVLSRLVERSGGNLGRTAIMKLAYFLTVLRGVPLGYHFSLYSYGPFDSTVLQDVDVATSLEALRSRPIVYPKGYGYSIQPGPASEDIGSLAKKFLDVHAADIDWVAHEFGNLVATDLELVSTIVYIDQESLPARIQRTDLARRVREIKPHFSENRILSSIEDLRTKGLLPACSD